MAGYFLFDVPGRTGRRRIGTIGILNYRRRREGQGWEDEKGNGILLMKNRKIYWVYTVCIFVILILPFAGMSVAPTTETTENKELAELPALYAEGEWNPQFLSELGLYFEDHFAFRPMMVTANARLWSGIFQTSPAERVIDGENEWLYYHGTLDDYQGTNLLSERSLFNIAHNLSMMQGMTEAMNARFYYTIAPNKNTLYGENMPYYYPGGGEGNLEGLLPYLEEEGVHYIDLVSVFEQEEEVLYLKRDSHWNNKGALLAYNTLLDAMGREHDDYSKVLCVKREDYIGDLNAMLFPLGAKPEENYYYLKEERYRYLNEADNVEEDLIEAGNPYGQGSILVYRDSFGNTLFPLIANEFERTCFTKLEPYSLSDVSRYRPEYVLVERVERRIASVIEQPPIMQGPMARVVPEQSADTDTTIETKKSGSYLVIQGKIDPKYLETRSRVFVSVHPSGQPGETAYEAFGWLTDPDNQEKNCDGGYQLYLMEQNVPADTDYDIEIIIVGDEGACTVAKKTNIRGE